MFDSHNNLFLITELTDLFKVNGKKTLVLTTDTEEVYDYDMIHGKLTVTVNTESKETTVLSICHHQNAMIVHYTNRGGSESININTKRLKELYENALGF